MQSCRICKNVNFVKILELGDNALANSFLKREGFLSEKVYPLDIYFCKDCRLVQLGELVPPEIMFSNYLYVSGTSDTMKKHFMEFANNIIQKISKFQDPLIVDVGSNDGTLLKGFLNHPVKILGVDPSDIAKLAQKNGIETVNDFFNKETAQKIVQDKGKAKAILGANVFAHTPDLDSFMEGINILLDEDGIFVIEFPYLVNLLKGMEFDTMYHEHVYHFSIMPLMVLFKKFGFEIFEIKETSVHGGSLRIFVRKGNGKSPENIQQVIDLEKKMELDLVKTYITFAKKVEKVRSDLKKILTDIKSDGKKIVGYGAAAKASTLLSYCKIESDTLEYIADKNPLKQNLYTPGTHIPVVSPKKILETKPDYLLILAWNMADEIIYQQKEFQDKGGKFIIPLPTPKIV
jgi:SAM-dependent methyltransferase